MFNSISRFVTTSKTLTFSVALVAAVAPAFVLGCGSSDGGPSGSGTVGATAVAYNRSTHALSATAGNLKFINGSYTGCTGVGHTNADLWSVALDGYAGVVPASNPALSVALNDTNCVLTITSLDADQNYATSGLAITGAFVTPSAFAFTVGLPTGTTAFYANDEIVAPGNFSADFTINVVYSDDPAAATGNATSTFAQVASSAESTQVVSPNYTADVSAVAITTDAANAVVTVGGNVTFPAGAGPALGQDYVIIAGTLADNAFTTEDTAFQTAIGTLHAVATLTSITAATFVSINDTLPESSTVIFRNTLNGVVAYEAVTLNFAAAM